MQRIFPISGRDRGDGLFELVDSFLLARRYRQHLHTLSVLGETTMTISYKEWELDDVIDELIPLLKIPGGIDPFCLLKAVAGKESSFGRNCKPRKERYYLPGGMYFEKSDELEELYQIYGERVGYSYGPFQIMYPTAVQYGYPKNRAPEELEKAGLSGVYVAKMINHKVALGSGTLEEIADAYNSGNSKDRRTEVVEQYVDEFVTIYHQQLRKQKIKEGKLCE